MKLSQLKKMPSKANKKPTKADYKAKLIKKAEKSVMFAVLLFLLAFGRNAILPMFGFTMQPIVDKFGCGLGEFWPVFAVMISGVICMFDSIRGFCKAYADELDKKMKNSPTLEKAKQAIDLLSENRLPTIKAMAIKFATLFLMCLLAHATVKMLMLMGFDKEFIQGDQHFAVLLLAVLALVINALFWNFFNETVNLMQGKSKAMKKANKTSKTMNTGKQYHLEQISKMLRESDIIEIEVRTLSDVITIGSSSDCKPGKFEFFDKAYYIGDKEYGLGQEHELLDELSHMCGGEPITVLSVDGVKEK